MTEVEAFARAWASMDGKLDRFIACKEDASIEAEEGRYGGYMHEAEELISRARKYLATSDKE